MKSKHSCWILEPLNEGQPMNCRLTEFGTARKATKQAKHIAVELTKILRTEIGCRIRFEKQAKDCHPGAYFDHWGVLRDRETGDRIAIASFCKNAETI